MRITGTKAKKLVSKGGKVFDVRSPVSFSQRAIPNSINLPLRNVSHLLKHIKKNEPVIFVGDSDTRKDVDMAAQYASSMGYQQIFEMDNIDIWETK